MFDYMSVQDVAKKWRISVRRIKYFVVKIESTVLFNMVIRERFQLMLKNLLICGYEKGDKIMKSKHSQYLKDICVLCFCGIMLFVVILLNYASYSMNGTDRIASVFSINDLLFLLSGMILLGISAFVAMQLFHYSTGKMFAMYTAVISLTMSLIPCIPLFPSILGCLIPICILISSLLLFMTLGQLTLLNQKKLFCFFQIFLCGFIALGIASQLFILIPINKVFIMVFASESPNLSILLCAAFSFFAIAFYYNKSNIHSKRQMKILLLGVSSGFILFIITSIMPYIYFVRKFNPVPEEIEILLTGDISGVITYTPLLLFSALSIAIVFILFKRDFISKESPIKLWQLIGTVFYFFAVNFFIYTFVSCSVWVVGCINILLFLPICYSFYLILKPAIRNSSEEVYQWNLLEELEEEREKLSVYLHDEVLQSLIAFYRKNQLNNLELDANMSIHLKKLITKTRQLSHELHPTIVEDLGLEQSLLSLKHELTDSYREIDIQCEYKLAGGILPKSFALTFYRIIRELTTNAAKHARCQCINIALSEDDTGYFLRVKDDGCGFTFPANDRLLDCPHMGLYTIKKQIMQLNGQMSFESNKNHGTDFYIYIPTKEGDKHEI